MQRILKANQRLDNGGTQYILRRIAQNLEIRQRASRMSFQCHIAALFNRPSQRSLNYLGECTFV